MDCSILIGVLNIFKTRDEHGNMFVLQINNNNNDFHKIKFITFTCYTKLNYIFIYIFEYMPGRSEGLFHT